MSSGFPSLLCAGSRLCRRRASADRESRTDDDFFRAKILPRKTLHAEGGMNLFNLFTQRQTAVIARERLQVVIAHARTEIGRSHLVDTLREEIIAVIVKHARISSDKVQLTVARREGISTLDLNIELPFHLDRRAPS
ncbi:cell division topological specificity factor MinE [Methylobacterium symbioticum]|uniref:cell division topological specificity factor MinE n=1 Tax=Methylobacterium symbioticum TaxID=2584084 RepID=UPI003F67F40A